MSKLEIARTKDNLLKYAVSQGHSNTEAVSSLLTKDANVLNFFCEEMEKDGLLELRAYATKDISTVKSYGIIPTSKTFYFLQINGGYERQFRKETLKETWMKTKIVASVLNAILILLIGYLSLK